MNIVYLTTHIAEEDFQSLRASVNPAGQHFHGKLIRALATCNDVHVYSLVPPATRVSFVQQQTELESVHYTYLTPYKNRYLRALFYPRKIVQRICEDAADADIIVYDSLNLSICKAANALSRRLNKPCIAVLTDDIRNITGVRKSYAKQILAINRRATGCFALTQRLARLYGLAEKQYVQPMLVEPYDVKPMKRERPYIYYGGALYEKDGVGDLIQAFNRFGEGFDLIIAGHGPYATEVEASAEKNPHIIYRGLISKQEHYAYIAGAALCMNPRRYNESIDAYAVPSKVMEYLTYGSRIASTLSTPIHQEFAFDIAWIEGGIDTFFEAHLDHGSLINAPENHAKTRILSEYGLQTTGEKFSEFLISLIHG